MPRPGKAPDFQTGPPGRVVVRASEQGHENHGLCHRKSSRAPILAGEPGDDHAPPSIGKATSRWLAARSAHDYSGGIRRFWPG
jgi:hypothetical protein